MAEDQQPIIIKRPKKGGGGHHGGAWKLAYADFVTAMMAFFLLMWLLSSVAKGDLKGIADYFQMPLKIAMFGGDGAGDASSVIKGGGNDLTREYGQVKGGQNQSSRRSIDPTNQKIQFEQQEREKLENLKKELQTLIEQNPLLNQFKKQLLIDITTEGLRIQIIDEKNRPMFDLASSELKPYTKIILHEIGKVLNDVPNRVSLTGHTDSTPYAGGEQGFGNWELSTNRANASRRELLAGGMSMDKVLRVVGQASTVLFDPSDPYAASNRRISIIVLNKRTEDAILRDGKPENVSDDDSVFSVPDVGAKPGAQ
ncbi:MAG TPA: flagellar motor protein MotB [Rhodocyclaceae bacterium]|jgi:chemotaxis protein MotB|nr:flagellar motor protein MotB [Rhodocyclaceae bacterium]